MCQVCTPYCFKTFMFDIPRRSNDDSNKRTLMMMILKLDDCFIQQMYTRNVRFSNLKCTVPLKLEFHALSLYSCIFIKIGEYEKSLQKITKMYFHWNLIFLQFLWSWLNNFQWLINCFNGIQSIFEKYLAMSTKIWFWNVFLKFKLYNLFGWVCAFACFYKGFVDITDFFNKISKYGFNRAYLNICGTSCGTSNSAVL